MIDFSGACPVPIRRYDRVLLGHGSGGQLSRDLVEHTIVPILGRSTLGDLEDQATLDLSLTSDEKLAITTDAFVVRPLFFPGGDIGSLAVHGTINDLAMGGAKPRYLTVALVLEEGLPMSELERVLRSMREAADRAEVEIVAGDTKVVERGKGDGVYVTTTGVGVVPAGRKLSVKNARAGDAVLLSGTIGDHGITVLSLREGLSFETALSSDSAPLTALVSRVLEAAPHTRLFRDPTRGGASATLSEIASQSKVGVELDEAAIPVRDEVRAACELFGLDPMYVANEGKLIAVVPEEEANAALAAMKSHDLGRNAARIGRVVARHPGMVIERSITGGERIIPLLSGEQLPRIC